MKYIKTFKLFEREMSKTWVDNNKDFYLIQNKEHLNNKSEVKTKMEALIDTLSMDSIKINKEKI